METYRKGELVTEPVTCPDGTTLKMRWGGLYDPATGGDVPSIEVDRGYDQRGFLGTGSFYTCGDLIVLGDGDLSRGINMIGQAWYRKPEEDIRLTEPAPMWEVIQRKKTGQSV